MFLAFNVDRKSIDIEPINLPVNLNNVHSALSLNVPDTVYLCIGIHCVSPFFKSLFTFVNITS